MQEKSIALVTNQLEYLNNQGLFTRVFLSECNTLPDKVGLRHEGAKPKWDLSRFLEYLTGLFKSLNQDGVHASFEFTSQTISVAFAVLADEYTWATRGIDFYKRRTRQSIQRGATTIYIIALGERNLKLAHNLALVLREQGYVINLQPSYYTLEFARQNKIAAACIRCDVGPYVGTQKIELETSSDELGILINDEKLHATVLSIIPDPDIEIIKSAWIEKYQAQLLVHSKNPSKNASQICIGKDGTRAKELQKLIGDYIRFIEWSPDLRDLIINNLDKHEKNEILDISIDPAIKQAYVKVKFTNTIADLVGNVGMTHKLAEALTDYSIEFQVDEKFELISQISKIIPNVNTGEIKIENLAKIQGQEIRILVSSDRHDNPASVCGEYIERLKSEINLSERIYFCSQRNNIEDSIVAALYPLRPDDVIRVEKDTTNGYVVIVKSEDAIARGIGTEGAHVRTASQLLGIKWIQLEMIDQR